MVNKSARVAYVNVEVDQDMIEAGHDYYSAKISDGVHEFLNAEGKSHVIFAIEIVDMD